jgi:hypothetical protein
MEKGLEKVIKLHSKRGFSVVVCLADLEFEVTRHASVDLALTLNTCGPGESFPEIERKMRTVKRRVRGLVMMLPISR